MTAQDVERTEPGRAGRPRKRVPGRLTSRRVVALVVLAVALLPPLLIDNVYHIQILGFVGIASLLAMGLNVIVGISNTFSLGHHAFYGLGAYTAALLATRLDMPFFVTVLAASFVAALFAFGIGPVMRLKGPFLAVATLAFGEIVFIVMMNWTSLTRGPNGISGIPAPSFFGFEFDTPHRFYYLILVFVVIEFVVISRMIDSRTGRAMKGMRDSEEAALARGVFVPFYKIQSFVIGGMFAGTAGALYAHFLSFISPDPFVLAGGIEMLFMIVLGGLGSVPGSIIGAGIVITLPEALRPLAEQRLIVYPILILLILRYAPRGIWGGIEALATRIVGHQVRASVLGDVPAVDEPDPATGEAEQERP